MLRSYKFIYFAYSVGSITYTNFMKKLRSNKSSEKYFYKQEGFVCKVYLHFTYKQSLTNIHYISFTLNCYTVCKQSCTKFFFIFYSGQHRPILLCDQTFINMGYV